MPYQIQRHADSLLWVTMQGHLAFEHADAYYHEMWRLLDGCTSSTDLLVDGRRIAGASPGARQRTEQIVHHPHLGHIAFVVSTHHLLLFAPLVKLVSGIGLFGAEHQAMDYLRASRGLPPLADLQLPIAPAAQPPHAAAPPARQEQAGPPPQRRQVPPDPASRVLHSLTDMLNGWSDNLRAAGRERERD